MAYIMSTGFVTRDRKTQFGLLQRIWFDEYSRDGGHHMGSSGFEHSFLTEVKNGEPMGLHNWIFFAMNENRPKSSHHIDYKGYMRAVHLNDVSYRLILVLFHLNGCPAVLVQAPIR